MARLWHQIGYFECKQEIRFMIFLLQNHRRSALTGVLIALQYYWGVLNIQTYTLMYIAMK